MKTVCIVAVVLIYQTSILTYVAHLKYISIRIQKLPNVKSGIDEKYSTWYGIEVSIVMVSTTYHYWLSIWDMKSS